MALTSDDFVISLQTLVIYMKLINLWKFKGSIELRLVNNIYSKLIHMLLDQETIQLSLNFESTNCRVFYLTPFCKY